MDHHENHEEPRRRSKIEINMNVNFPMSILTDLAITHEEEMKCTKH